MPNTNNNFNSEKKLATRKLSPMKAAKAGIPYYAKLLGGYFCVSALRSKAVLDSSRMLDPYNPSLRARPETLKLLLATDEMGPSEISALFLTFKGVISRTLVATVFIAL